MAAETRTSDAHPVLAHDALSPLPRPALLLGGVLGLLGAIALLIGLVAVYLHQHDRLGGLGTVGVFVALTGAAMSVGGVWTQVFVTPFLIAEAPELLEQGAGPLLAGYLMSYSLLGVGALLFSIATLRAWRRCRAGTSCSASPCRLGVHMSDRRHPARRTGVKATTA